MDGKNNPQQNKPPAGQSLDNTPGANQAPKQPAAPQAPPQTPQTPPQGSAPSQTPTAGQIQPDKGKTNGKALLIGLVVIALLAGLGVGFMLGSV